MVLLILKYTDAELTNAYLKIKMNLCKVYFHPQLTKQV